MLFREGTNSVRLSERLGSNPNIWFFGCLPAITAKPELTFFAFARRRPSRIETGRADLNAATSEVSWAFELFLPSSIFMKCDFVEETKSRYSDDNRAWSELPSFVK